MSWTLITILALVGIALLAAAVFLRSATSGQGVSSLLFGPKPDKRIGVIEQASVDGRRKLVLVRRDDVEHLILIGGPVDVVVETGIGEPQPLAVQRLRAVNGTGGNGSGTGAHVDGGRDGANPPTFGRAARSIGPASANE